MSHNPDYQSGSSEQSARSRMMRDSLHAGLLLCVPALVAWLSGRAFIFPSLGPSAFELALSGTHGEAGVRQTGRALLGGHLIGVLCGLLCYHLLANGLSLDRLAGPGSQQVLALVASGVLSVVLTSAGMLATGLRHAPACATTLIVSLGLLTTLADALFIMVAISLMFGVHVIATHKTGGRTKRQP